MGPTADRTRAQSPTGSPNVYVELPPRAGNNFDASRRYPISISHCCRHAAAALAGSGMRVGADVETVALRESSWIDLIAHESERSPELRQDPVGQTVLWTLKEAVTKTLGTGLSVGFQDVRFLPDGHGAATAALGPVRLELHGEARRAWEEIGRPNLAFESALLDDRSALSVAYTLSQ